MQQPNDKYEENKSTPSQIPEQICIKKKKEEIHTFGATTKQQLQYWLSIPFQGVFLQ